MQSVVALPGTARAFDRQTAKGKIMPSGRDRFPFKLAWLTAALLLLVALWRYLPLVETVSGAERAAPRSVTLRGDLAADEKSTIEIFEKSKNSVVFIST